MTESYLVAVDAPLGALTYLPPESESFSNVVKPSKFHSANGVCTA